MSSMFSRTLLFFSENLGAEATLILTFDNQIEGLYKDKFPVVWKVKKFPSEGAHQLVDTYENQLAFLKPQVDRETNKIEAVAAFELIDIGQVTALTKDDSGVYGFTDPTGVVQVKNDSPETEDMALGFFRKHKDMVPTPILYFRGIGPDSSEQAQFAPILRAYITDEFQEKQIIVGGVNTSPIWEVDLSKLNENTNWALSRDEATGAFKITAA